MLFPEFAGSPRRLLALVDRDGRTILGRVAGPQATRGSLEARLPFTVRASTANPGLERAEAGTRRRLYQGPGFPAGLGRVELSADARYAVFHEVRGNEFVVRDLTTGSETRVPHPSLDALAAEWRGTSTETANGVLMSAALSPDRGRIVYGVFVRLGPLQSRGGFSRRSACPMHRSHGWSRDGRVAMLVSEAEWLRRGRRTAQLVQERLQELEGLPEESPGRLHDPGERAADAALVEGQLIRRERVPEVVRTAPEEPPGAIEYRPASLLRREDLQDEPGRLELRPPDARELPLISASTKP